MELKEKLLNLRSKKGLTQKQVAEALGITISTMTRYENGERIPKRDILEKFAEFYDVDLDYLLDNTTSFILSAQEADGSKGKADAERLIANANSLFSGGSISEEDKDIVMQALQNVYWEAKQINKKYTPKKYRKDEDDKK